MPSACLARAALDVGVRVVVGAEDADDRVVMAARVEAPIATHEVAIVEGRAEAPLPEAARAFVPHVGSGMLVRDGFVWADVEVDVARLRAGVDLLGALANTTQGAYR